MGSSLLRPFKITLLIILCSAVTLTAGKFFYPLGMERARLVKVRNALRHDNEVLSHNIAELRRYQTDFSNDPEYIELVARREGLVRKNEVVFDFNDKKVR